MTESRPHQRAYGEPLTPHEEEFLRGAIARYGAPAPKEAHRLIAGLLVMLDAARAEALSSHSDVSADLALGRAFRAALAGLHPDYRLGFVRVDGGWRSVLLAPDSGQPVAVADSPDIDGLFGIEGGSA